MATKGNSTTAKQMVRRREAFGISLVLAQKTKHPEGLKRGGFGSKPGRAKSAAGATPVESEAGTKAKWSAEPLKACRRSFARGT